MKERELPALDSTEPSATITDNRPLKYEISIDKFSANRFIISIHEYRTPIKVTKDNPDMKDIVDKFKEKLLYQDQFLRFKKLKKSHVLTIEKMLDEKR